MAFILKSPKEIMLEISQRFKAERLRQNLTQAGVSVRSGVSLGSLKRFEQSGEISLISLLDLAIVLGRVDDFENLFADNRPSGSLFTKKEEKIRQRGRVK